MTIEPIHLNGLLVALISVVLIPGAIVVASLVLSAANESAGWLRYKLPEVFFWIFLATGLASPFLGIGTLVLLWTLQRRVSVNIGKTEPNRRRALILAAVTAIVPPGPFWFFSWRVEAARSTADRLAQAGESIALAPLPARPDWGQPSCARSNLAQPARQYLIFNSAAKPQSWAEFGESALPKSFVFDALSSGSRLKTLTWSGFASESCFKG